jgi:zinc/manganese transport system substrate-binding protein
MDMKSTLTFISAACAILATMPAVAALNVFACEPEWGALAQELGGDKVSVYSATTALQDPHRIEARPSLIARVRTADLVVCTGNDLEVGWLPLLLSQAGNAKVRPGKPGFLEASQLVVRIEVPKVVDRSLGDIHPGGNPHIHMDPRNIARVAEALSGRLTQIDTANADTYRARAASFQERWRTAVQRWEQQAAQLRGMPIVVYHKDMSYLINWLGLREAGALEPKPGIPPSPSQLAELVQRLEREPARAVVYSAYNDPRAAQFLSERARIPAVMLPFTVGGSDKAKDLFGLFDDTLARLLGVAK